MWSYRWREIAILFGWTVSVLLTVWVWRDSICFPPEIWKDPAKIEGAIYAAWIGGVALFTVVGAVAALVSLTRPEEESFDSRARILFRRQSGPHIDYIISRIREQFEHYSERTTIKIEIRDFNAAEAKYHIAETTTHLLRSYISDIPTTYNSDMKYATLTSPPAGSQPNRLVYLRLNSVPIGGSEDMTGNFSRPVSATINPNQVCAFASKVELWVMRDTEPNDFAPMRYTQSLSMEIENELDQPVTIKFQRLGQGEEFINLSPGEGTRIFQFSDLKPRQSAYVYHICACTGL